MANGITQAIHGGGCPQGGRCHCSAHHGEHRAAYVTLHDAPRNHGNEGDTQGKEYARKTQQERLADAGKESTGIAASEDFRHCPELDRRHEASKNGVDQSPRVKDDQVRQVTPCKPCSAQGRISASPYTRWETAHVGTRSYRLSAMKWLSCVVSSWSICRQTQRITLF